MRTSVGMKAQKKQLKDSAAEVDLDAASDPALQRALLTLENVCVRILDSQFTGYEDEEGEQLYWQQRIRNIVTPISLALAESKGPRHFHYHYRHSKTDESVLQPVLEPTIDMLARTCQHALDGCAKKLAGIHDRDLIKRQQMLESALRTFLMRYEDYQEKAA